MSPVRTVLNWIAGILAALTTAAFFAVVLGVGITTGNAQVHPVTGASAPAENVGVILACPH